MMALPTWSWFSQDHIQHQSPQTNPLTYLGLLTLTFSTLALTRQATLYLLPSKLAQYNDTHKSWALVTGATDGIGYGFCEELCARGFNVILHGRNKSKLEARVAELSAQFPDRMISFVVMDVVGITDTVDVIADQVSRVVRAGGGELSVLVNNVGGETRPYIPLVEYSFDDVDATIAKNAGFMTHITRVLLPLLANAKRGLVLNVSSISSFGMPYLSVYSATKGFVDSFTRALEAECAAEKPSVTVMGLRVGAVKTAGLDMETSLFVPSARQLARAGLDRVGCGKTIVWGYFWHWVQGLSFALLPRWMFVKILTQKLMTLKKEKEAKRKGE